MCKFVHIEMCARHRLFSHWYIRICCIIQYIYLQCRHIPTERFKVANYYIKLLAFMDLEIRKRRLYSCRNFKTLYLIAVFLAIPINNDFGNCFHNFVLLTLKSSWKFNEITDANLKLLLVFFFIFVSLLETQANISSLSVNARQWDLLEYLRRLCF